MKKFRASARNGDLRELRKAIDNAGKAIDALKQQFSNAREGWDFDEDGYFSGRGFLDEVLAVARESGLKIFEQDDRLFCYPFLLRVLPRDRLVLIDKARERRVRPSVLARHLKDLQGRPVRFRPEDFLECLFDAYTIKDAGRGKDISTSGHVMKLREIYRVLTLLPGQSKEYSLHEFSRDIYLLDKSRVTRTRKGMVVSFPASTGTRAATSGITVVTEHGEEKKYYGISFAGA